MRHTTQGSQRVDVPEDTVTSDFWMWHVDLKTSTRCCRRALGISAGAAAAGGALGEVADATEGFSGREIAKVRREWNEWNKTSETSTRPQHCAQLGKRAPSAPVDPPHDLKHPPGRPPFIHHRGRQGRVAKEGSPRKGRQGRVVQKGSSRKGRRGRVAKEGSSRKGRPERVVEEGSSVGRGGLDDS